MIYNFFYKSIVKRSWVIKLYRDPLVYLTFKLLVNGEREQEVSNNDDFLSVIEMLILLKLES